MTKNNDSIAKTLRAWQRALSVLETDTLNSAIKSAARAFELDKNDEAKMAEYQAALDTKSGASKAKYILGFDPLDTEDGILAYLVSKARRWGIEVPNSYEEPITAGGSKRTYKVVKTKRADVETATKKKATGGRVFLNLSGRPDKLATAFGFRKEVDPVKRTMLRKTASMQVMTDENGLSVQVSASNIGKATRFLRTRCTNELLLRKVQIMDREGYTPELDERLMRRAKLEAGRGGRLEVMAA